MRQRGACALGQYRVLRNRRSSPPFDIRCRPKRDGDWPAARGSPSSDMQPEPEPALPGAEPYASASSAARRAARRRGDGA